jgi:hypothetical protein
MNMKKFCFTRPDCDPASRLTIREIRIAQQLHSFALKQTALHLIADMQ